MIIFGPHVFLPLCSLYSVPLTIHSRKRLCIASLLSDETAMVLMVTNWSTILENTSLSLAVSLRKFSYANNGEIIGQFFLLCGLVLWFENNTFTLGQLSWSSREWLSKNVNALPFKVVQNLGITPTSCTSYDLHNMKKMLRCSPQLFILSSAESFVFGISGLNCL